MLVIGLMAMAVQAAGVCYSFEEISSGTWEVSVTVTGNTAGLSAYEFFVNVDPSLVSYTENTLSTINEDFMLVGFTPGNLLSGDVDGRFNAGNYQSYGNSVISGIGMMPVYEQSCFPSQIPNVQLGVPALLGTLTTPAGLGYGDFSVSSAGLLKPDNSGYLADDITVTLEIPGVPKPPSPSAVQWKVENGGNGHWYEVVVVPTGINWTQANDAASSKNGHLATITSQAENDFIFSLIDDSEYWVTDSYGFDCGPLIGGVQSEGAVDPSEGWGWVTGEAMSFTAWAPGQPNNVGDQTRIQFWNSRSINSTWQDVSVTETEFSYIVEYDVPEPATLCVMAFGAAALIRMRRA